MIIGTVRVEEARVFDSKAGVHRFNDDDGAAISPPFEVFWHNGGIVEDGAAEGHELERAGWYWLRLCSDGCCANLFDREPHGPFARSSQAYDDAMEQE